MNVWKLNSNWTDMKVLNQKLNEIIINNLYNSFTAEIKWTAVNNRMKIMCTKNKFIKIITHHDIKILKKEELKTTDEIFRTMIRNMLTWAKKKRSDNFVTVLFWLKTDNFILNVD